MNPSSPGTTLEVDPDQDTGLLPFYAEMGVNTLAFYGYGKWAIRDALDLIGDDHQKESVVIPALFPAGAVEAIRDAGFTPRFHRIKPDLSPEFPHLDSLVGEGTAAILLVHYLGFPQSRATISAIRSRANDYDALFIEDAAQAGLTTTNDRILGTAGDVGMTSLHKLFQIPNGAALIINESDLPVWKLTRVGVKPWPSSVDVRYYTNRLAHRIRTAPPVREVVSGLPFFPDFRSNGSHSSPAAIYRRSQVPMSRLSRDLLDHIDPAWVISTRRSNYATWEDHLSMFEGATPLRQRLPTGVCPLWYPVMVEDANLDEHLPLHQWPKLSREVRDSDRFPTANRMAKRLRGFPVDQRLSPEDLERLARNAGVLEGAPASRRN